MADNQSAGERFFFNGINGATGDYMIPAMTGEELARFIKGEDAPSNIDELKHRKQREESTHYGLAEGFDPKSLADAGWGIVFAHDADPAVKEALSDLIELRKGQAGERFRLYEGADGYRPGETKLDFIARHNTAPGVVDPDRMPYYLLIVGGPQTIPFDFQYQMDVQFAVGRIHFDTIQEYANYAASVKAAENGDIKLSRQAAFFGVSNPDDRATAFSCEHLVNPLVDFVKNDQPDWNTAAYLKEDAVKSRLSDLLCGDHVPSLLFTASHGMGFPLNDSRQVPHQGALLCGDWPGPQAWKKDIPPDFYFSAEDIPSDARLAGMMAFCFACYGAGVPQTDAFSHQHPDQRKALAPYPFLASLPRRLLGHPGGGALAVIGHVERAWGYSFMWPDVDPQTIVFKSTLKRLLEGHPAGSAFEFFNSRYAELGTELSRLLQDMQYGRKISPLELAGIWTSGNDARNYVILGDPAVRLPVSDEAENMAKRPVISVKTAGESQPSNQGAEKMETDEKRQQAQQRLAELDYGLLDLGKNVTSSLKNVSGKLTNILSSTVEDLTSLEVKTYTSDEIEGETYDAGSRSYVGKARLRAQTRISLDGDIVHVVPERRAEGDETGTRNLEIDERLWNIHKEMVQVAQANRVNFVKTLGEVIGSLLKVV